MLHWVFSDSLRLKVSDHDASEDGHHHLCLHFDDVVWKCIDACANLTSHRNRILGIVQPFLEYQLSQVFLWNSLSLSSSNKYYQVKFYSWNKQKSQVKQTKPEISLLISQLSWVDASIIKRLGLKSLLTYTYAIGALAILFIVFRRKEFTTKNWISSILSSNEFCRSQERKYDCCTCCVCPAFTRSYFTDPGLHASTKSMIALESAIDWSLKPWIRLFFPADASCLKSKETSSHTLM